MTWCYMDLYQITDTPHTLRNACDSAGRLTRINDWLDGTVGIQYAHDALGRLTTITDYDYNKEFAYTCADADNRTMQRRYYNITSRASRLLPKLHLGTHLLLKLNFFLSGVLKFRREARLLRAWSQSTTLRTIAFPNAIWERAVAGYARGQLASITAPGSRVWDFQYNALGQRTQYTHPNGTRTEYAYDTRNRLTGIYHKNASTDAVLDSYVYTLNDGGAITRMDQADNSYWTYGYDQRNRLGLATRRNTQGSILHIFGYDYDAADNMTQRWRFQASNSQTDIWEYDYNTANEQIAMTLNAGTPETRSYDAWGRLATRAQGAYSATYGYRYGSRLYQATSNFPGESNVTYDYGGDGKRRWRVTASETRRYRHDRGWNVIQGILGTSYLIIPVSGINAS